MRLLNRDRRRNAADVVHARLVHAVEELPHVRAERLDVTALALSVNGFEGERRFAGTARSGNNGQFSERKIDVDAFEVVLARPADLNAGRRRDRGQAFFFSNLRTHWRLSE